jgi:hypothetical protein
MLENYMRLAPSSWSAERSTLIADALCPSSHTPLSECPRVRLRVHGESMLPTLWPGEVVEIAACSADDARPGEIVLALRDGRLFLHRLVSYRAQLGFVLRGDSMPACDPIFARETMLGRLVPQGGQARRVSASVRARAMGLLLCYCGPIRRLALTLHRRQSAWTVNFRNSSSRSEPGT